MTHDELIDRITDWIRFWAPEVKKRIERKEPRFQELVDEYELLRKEPDSTPRAEQVWDRMQTCQKILNDAPPGAYDYLAHIGTYVP